MSDKSAKLLEAFETHSPGKIRELLASGLSPVKPIKDKLPIVWAYEMYLRSPKFAECFRVMLDAGATLDDPLLEALLLDDAEALTKFPSAPQRKFFLECTFTPLKGVSALHICAEYNSVKCAKALIEAGAAVDSRADIDEDGIGGHTPLFQSVNSHRNYSRPMMELLVEAGADLNIRLKGLIWGCGFEWETAIFDVTPISYAQCGLYKQFQRDDTGVFSNVAYLYKHRYGKELQLRNVPNKYLAS